MDITIDSIQAAYKKMGYTLFLADTKEYNLNIFGIRAKEYNTDTFNDFIGLLWKYNGALNLKVYDCTTDPGIYYFKNPMSPAGTHILKSGQYKGAYQYGMHKGLYQALVQVKGMNFYEDNDRDGEFDKTKIITNYYAGANIHASINTKEQIDIFTHDWTNYPIYNTVYNWSAACQVFNDVKEYVEFMGICKKSADTFGNSFTYTLFEEAEIA